MRRFSTSCRRKFLLRCCLAVAPSIRSILPALGCRVKIRNTPIYTLLFGRVMFYVAITYHAMPSVTDNNLNGYYVKMPTITTIIMATLHISSDFDKLSLIKV
jgi:hypothetical protein